MKIYRDILKNSFLLSIKNKYFWFFGLFASLVGISSEYDFFFRGLRGETGESYLIEFKRFASTGVLSFGVFGNIVDLFKTDTFSMLIVLLLSLILLALTIFLIWISIASQIAIVNNSAKMIMGKNTDFKDGVMAGVQNFWPILGLNIIIKIIMSAVFFIIGAPFLFKALSSNLLASNSLYILFFVIFLPIGIIAAFIVKYAIAFVVIKKESFAKSLKSGLELFQKNWLVSIEMAFILFFVSFLAVLTIAIITLILTIPVLFVAFLFNYIFGSMGFWTIFMFGILALIFIFMLGGAIISSFQIISWTRFFLDLSGRGVASKISRVVSGFGK